MSDMIFNGMRVVIAEPIRYEFTTNRSWKDRLFTLPFSPFKSTKTEVKWTNPIEDGQVVNNQSYLYMTEKTWLQLQESNRFQR